MSASKPLKHVRELIVYARKRGIKAVASPRGNSHIFVELTNESTGARQTMTVAASPSCRRAEINNKKVIDRLVKDSSR